MLTLKDILAVTRQQAAFGEGQHRFGHGMAPVVSVPRDRTARPRTVDAESGETPGTETALEVPTNTEKRVP